MILCEAESCEKTLEFHNDFGPCLAMAVIGPTEAQVARVFRQKRQEAWPLAATCSICLLAQKLPQNNNLARA